MVDEEKIANNYLEVLEKIQKAAKSANRSPDEIKLLVVTKKQPVEAIRAVYRAGASVMGENYAEEAALKLIEVAKPDYKIEWHMIGHVQSRKADLVCQTFDFVESVDSLELAIRLDKKCLALHKTMPILLELNVGGEASKSGWSLEGDEPRQKIEMEIEQILQLSNLQMRGLMTMPPLFDNDELTRPYFLKLAHLRDEFQKKFPGASWGELSMGTSHDYEIAISEGATIVRIGQAILGPRG